MTDTHKQINHITDIGELRARINAAQEPLLGIETVIKLLRQVEIDDDNDKNTLIRGAIDLLEYHDGEIVRLLCP